MSNQAFSRSPARARPIPQPPASPGHPPQSRQRAPLSLGAATARFTHYLAQPLLAVGPLIFAGAVIAALYATWLNRDEGHLTPEYGLGYWLGIIGSVMMLVLLLYPLRKRVRALRVLGRVPSWFRLHMILGIVGPSLVLMHSNWKFASLNATVAMVAMLIVVGSGIVGRYLYSKVHMGLYGRKTEVRQILADASLLKQALGDDLPQTQKLLDELRAFEVRILAPRHGFLSQTYAFLTLGFRRGALRSRLMRFANATIAAEAKRRGWSWAARRKRRNLAREHLRLYFAAVTKAARFGVYERLFALWHVLHMPLFFLLVTAAIIHVVAVHRY